MPNLSFMIDEASVVPFAIAPTLAFKLRIKNADPVRTIHTVALRCQIQLEVTRRRYTPGARQHARSLRRARPLESDPSKPALDPYQCCRAQLSGLHIDRPSYPLYFRFQRC